MANLRKNIARKRALQKRANIANRKGNYASNETESHYRVSAGLKSKTAGRGKSLSATIEEVKSLRESLDPQLQHLPTYVYHRYGKNSVRKIKVV